jgi:hypothetical protein
VEIGATNVPPTATLSAPPAVDAGAPIVISLSNVFDPSTADTAMGLFFSLDCGDGNTSLGGQVWGTSSPSLSCPTDGGGTRTVHGEICDAGGVDHCNDYTATVGINVPGAALSGGGNVNEGGSLPFSFTNPSANAVAFAVDCTGAGSFTAPAPLAPFGCAYDDGPASGNVNVRVYDAAGFYSTVTAPFTVVNAAPAATFTGSDGTPGLPIAFSFSNPSDASQADTQAGFHYAVSCGAPFAGNPTYAASSASPSATCNFANAGTYTVYGRIIDKDGGYTQYTWTTNVDGRMNGEAHVGSTHFGGFEMHCDRNRPNNLQVKWSGGSFSLDALTSVTCSNDPRIGSPAPPDAHFNTMTGVGTGHLGKDAGATVTFTIADAGEPHTNDTFTFQVKNAAGVTVFSSPLQLSQGGNIQAHDR